MKTIELQLKELIISEYGSLKAFTDVINMPWTTLDSILKRGIDKANITNVLKITAELNLDTEKLALGILQCKDVPDIDTIAAHHDEVDWTSEELEEIENFKKYVLSKRNK